MEYKIPLFDLNFDEQESQAVVETMRSKWISMGPKTEELESKFSSMLNNIYTVALSNCTVALHLAMRLLDIGEDDEVICPSLTFVATVNAIRYVKAKPVFCDIKSYHDLTIDPDDIEAKISRKTKAIIVMHYGGFSCDMDKIMAVAQKHDVKVIEDASHAPLSEYAGKKLGTIGEIGCFSFFSNKNISTGEGGMLVTNNNEIYEKAKLLRSHGMTSLSYDRSRGHTTSYDVIDLGYNYRIDDIRASIGIVQLSKLKNDLIKRFDVRKYYIERLTAIKEIIIPFKENVHFSSNYIFPVVIKDSTTELRDMIREKLQDSGVQTSVHYPAVHLFSIYEEFTTELPITEYVTQNEITLPMYSHITKNDIDYVVQILESVF